MSKKIRKEIGKLFQTFRVFEKLYIKTNSDGSYERATDEPKEKRFPFRQIFLPALMEQNPHLDPERKGLMFNKKLPTYPVKAKSRKLSQLINKFSLKLKRTVKVFFHISIIIQLLLFLSTLIEENTAIKKNQDLVILKDFY
ncbi:CLUMA_CG008666, isoform A [Clunio marinus]|uniref:CLUMA_CG008666, isoform A n=1 Tax=Clunio marinus TaxID=568069 RepID=A0A1J1I4T8_9DIPT|nr:CLUMA_CG008666, isoform A [Clunio marinus]